MTDVLDAPACHQYHLFEPTCNAFWCNGDTDIELSAHYSHTSHCEYDAAHCAVHCPRFKCAFCNVRDNDTLTCSVCGLCIDNCCQCWTCDNCDKRSLERNCDNCDNCPECCECPVCDTCALRCTSICENCERCANCCECVKCSACRAKYAADSLCSDCCRCDDCGCVCEEADIEDEDNDPSGSSLPHDTVSFRSSQSRTLSNDPDAVDNFARKRTTDVTFPFLGSGASKNVYNLGDGYVLKVHIPASIWGNQVKRECQRWARARDGQRKYMAPIIAHSADYKWSIQTKANCETHAPHNAVSEIKDALPWGDFHGANVAKLHGKWVAIDYGF